MSKHHNYDDGANYNILSMPNNHLVLETGQIYDLDKLGNRQSTWFEFITNWEPELTKNLAGLSSVINIEEILSWFEFQSEPVAST